MSALALVQLLYILLTTNDIVSGQAIIGEEYYVRGSLSANDDNTIEIRADSTDGLIDQLGATADGSEFDGWYLESYKGLAVLTYKATRLYSFATYWD
eukprot:89698_1